LIEAVVITLLREDFRSCGKTLIEEVNVAFSKLLRVVVCYTYKEVTKVGW